MTTTLSFSFQHRPLVPFAHDYQHHRRRGIYPQQAPRRRA
ncbi:hypothetical protein ACP3UH_28380, partial [Klebsiella pneumoniae]